MEPLSRQVVRHLTRLAQQQQKAQAAAAARKEAQRRLLERQTRREKAGFYGRPLADFIAPSRSRVTKRKVKKGQAFCRIIETKTESGRELQFHATKGWRSYRSAA
ncbi:hypothetical protein [Mesorhizobium sp. B2-1-3A]|uniref:hypothetical protein n=1 Tax=Mesorhizobium sp. B2-1-3A TaxID=2589971 RepID=UPI00112D2C60|nr:hypothetical protein [Mesorhizobium sp. B2-1-3A]TPM89833.1 hypothetical protein FJ977_35215 [Mesorhizobium sp. B2-1-3A]